MAPPPPASARVSVRTRVPAELGQRPEPAWVEFAAGLPEHAGARGRLMPNRGEQELIAVRCQNAHRDRGWTIDQLTRLLVSDLERCQSLARVWLHRLHPDNLPILGTAAVPISQAARRPTVTGPAPERVSAARIAEIRAAAGITRGERWSGLMATTATTAS